MGNFLLFFNISGGEIVLIVIVVYLVFGPKKIPELARMLGKGINELRRATDDIRQEISREANKLKEDINIDVDDPLEEITKRRKRDAAKPKNPAPENQESKYSEPGVNENTEPAKAPETYTSKATKNKQPEHSESPEDKKNKPRNPDQG